mgnify:FL=1
MDRAHLAALLSPYDVNQFESFRVVDSSKPNDYRLNIIVDRGYVVRINDPVITEERWEQLTVWPRVTAQSM